VRYRLSQMTDSTTDQPGRLERGRDKRERLVEGACRAFYEHGVEHTTIADISRIADVPLGNVYYYFKTKDELVEAVIASHAELVAATLGGLERHRNPKDRLKAFARLVRDQGGKRRREAARRRRQEQLHEKVRGRRLGAVSRESSIESRLPGGSPMCAEYERQLGGGSPLPSLMAAKG